MHNLYSVYVHIICILSFTVAVDFFLIRESKSGLYDQWAKLKWTFSTWMGGLPIQNSGYARDNAAQRASWKV